MICDLAASNTKRHLTQVPLVDQYKSQLSLGGARLVISRRTVNTKPICGWLHHLQKFMNPQALAEAVAEGLKEAGCEVDTPNTNDGRYDVTQFPHAARRLCGLWLAGLNLLRGRQSQAVHGRSFASLTCARGCRGSRASRMPSFARTTAGLACAMGW